MKPAQKFCLSFNPRTSRALFVAGLLVLIIFATQPVCAGGSAPKPSGGPSKASGGLGPNRTGDIASMLEGTWQATDGSLLYLGPVDAGTELGRCVVSDPRQRSRYYHTYRLRHADETTRTARIEILFKERRVPPSVQELELSADGKTAQRRLIGTGFSLLQFIRLDESRRDTLTYVGSAEA